MISTLQLQYFCALAHKQNLTKCAEEFYISQSTLSNSLARMEADLDVRLFDRVGRSLILNNYGKIYLQYAEAALKALENGKRAVANELNEQKHKVIVYTISPLLFSGPIDRFAWKHPEYDIIQAMIDTRNRQHITQKDLSEASGISLADIRGLENGTADPSLSMLKRLAAGMGTRLKIAFIPLQKQ